MKNNKSQEETSQKSVQVIISDGYSAYQNKTCQPYAGKQGRQKQSQQGGLMFYFPLLYLIYLNFYILQCM